jgi:hypothetical protein
MLKKKEKSNLVPTLNLIIKVGGVYNISSTVENYVLGITQQTGGVGIQLWCWDTPW